MEEYPSTSEIRTPGHGLFFLNLAANVEQSKWSAKKGSGSM